MSVAQKIYAEVVRDLEVSDRVQLAQLILRDIGPDSSDYSDEWSDEDLADLSAAALRYARAECGEEDKPEC